MNNLGLRQSVFVMLSIFLLIIDGCRSGGDSSPPAATGGAVSLSGSIKLVTGGTIILSGSIKYEDKLYDNSGFTGSTIFKPIRFASIEVVRDIDSAVLSSTITDSDGIYSLVFTNTDSPGIYIRVIAETSNLHVKNNVINGNIYAARSDTFDTSKAGDFTTLSVWAGGAFNILDVLTDGMIFLSSLTGTPQPMLTAFWEKNSCDGTYFDGFDNSIHLLGGCPVANPGDTDEYDDDIILHEFGHFAAANFSEDDSQGGDHFLDDNTEDIRLAWSEGWAHFFSSAIRGNPRQVDTILSIASSFEIEGPSPLASSTIYTTSEVSVATVLWDIFDNTNEAFDALSLGISPIWDVFYGYLPTAPSVSIEDFWDGWFKRGHGFETEMLNITEDRKMELFEDNFEQDNSPDPTRKITVNEPAKHHTIYPLGDKDVVAFDVTQGQTYTIETLNLSNGADTFLEILDSNGTTVIASNDNYSGITYPINCFMCPPNDATTLSSRVKITASNTGILYARITRSSSAPNSAGMYGSYDLKASFP